MTSPGAPTRPVWLRRLRLALALLAAPWLALVALAALTPLPPALRPDQGTSTRVLDRDGRLLRHARAGDGSWRQPTHLDDLDPRLPAALVATEDRRFYWHPGVDPLAITRAAAELLWHRRIVSGGSTLTQQLARTLVPRPRTLPGKVREMALAVRLEWSLSKRQILEQYLERVAFGPTTRGVEAASRTLFDRAPRELSLAQVALLAGLPQSPVGHDPRLHPGRALRRRDQVLDRIARAHLAPPDAIERARHEPLALTHHRPPPLAPHLIDALLTSPLGPGPAAEITTTLDPDLQQQAEEAARRTVESLAARSVTAASVVVVDNATGDLLAYVGSPDARDARRLGANDGVRARRQPGSSLKPFVYELAIERLHASPATLLPDLDLTFSTPSGPFAPRNYDGRFHGPVRLREALGNSYNVPAVWTASELGPRPLLDRLHDLGLTSLDEPADHYGVALALGDGEVTLLELAGAYATLARGGSSLPPRAFRSWRRPDGTPVTPALLSPRRVLDPTAVALVTSMLSDPQARRSSFGAGSALEFSFPAAAKTGTSKGFRDNIAAGYTSEVTVVTWVGNFDGRPMQGVSGVTGAGPLMHDVLVAAMERRAPAPLFTATLAHERVCALSGALAGADCPHALDESFDPAHRPTERCTMHRRVRMDVRTGGRAGPGCPPDDVTERVVEEFPPMYRSWAREAGRPLAPALPSPRCPPGRDDGSIDVAPRITSPPDGAVLLLDRQLTAVQSIAIAVEAPVGPRLRLRVDGEPRELSGPPFAVRWTLRPGPHRIDLEVDGQVAHAITFRVDD